MLFATPSSRTATLGFPGANGAITFEQSGDLFIVSASGGEPTLIRKRRDVDDRASFPSWSPDGRSILFVHGVRGQDIQLRTISATGTDERVRRSAAYAYGPHSWSPGGQLVATASSAVHDWGDVRSVIYAGSRQLTRSPRPPNDRSDQSPAWAPDNSAICFERSGSPTALYLIKPTGGKATRLTAGRDPDWSPGAGRLAFVRNGDLYLIRRDGRGERRVTRTQHAEAAPAWSPDGTEIAFRRAVGLWALRLSDGHIRLIARPVTREAEPDWQPLRR
jgi:Tol biopolymer transport system component